MKNEKIISLFGVFVCLFVFTISLTTVVFAAAPTVSLNATSNPTTSTSGTAGITLNGSFNPNSISTTAYFRVWQNDPGSCIDAGGTRWPTSSGTTFADGTSHAFSQVLTGLMPNTTYYYCGIATNTSAQTSYHSTTTSSFNTSNIGESACDVPPDTTSGYTITAGTTCAFPQTVATTGLSLGTVTGMDSGTLTIGSGATMQIQSGQTVVFQSIQKSGSYINKISGGTMRKGYIWVKDVDGDKYFAPGSAVYDASAVTPPGAGYVRRNTLTAGGSYLTQAVDCNDNDASKNIPSTCAPANTAASSVTNVTATSATLNGTSNPNGDAGTQAYFKYGTVNTGDCSTLHGTGGASTSASLITGTTSQPFSANISSLVAGTTYYWCSIVLNNLGTTYSTIGTFVPIGPPTGVTLSGVTQTNITVSWTPPSGAAGFKIYRCAGASCTPTSFLATDSDNVSPYADSSVSCGTTYGYQVTATTGAGGTGTESSKSTIAYQATNSCVSAPTLASPTATSITGTSATLGATVTSNGGASLNARGTCWSTTDTTPQLGEAGVNCLAEGGTAVSAFSHSRTGLPASSTIYYSGYATNTSALTGYTFSSFITPALLANGSVCTAGSECQSGNCYVDADGDRHAPSSGTKTCKASTELAGVDCYDTSGGTGAASTYTGQTSYFQTANGLGSFDYDCSGAPTANQTYSTYCSSTSTPTLQSFNDAGCTVLINGNYNLRCTASSAWSLPTACGKYGNTGVWYGDSGSGGWCAYHEAIATSFKTGCR